MIYLAGEVNDEMFLDVMKRLDKRPKRINVCINSGGGYLCDGLAIYDRIKWVPESMITATGDCSSAALVILQAGQVRRATPNTTFVIHLSSVGPSKESPEGDAMSAEARATKVVLDSVIQKLYRQRITEDNLILALRKRCFDVYKALEYGFIDEVWNGESVLTMQDTKGFKPFREG